MEPSKQLAKVVFDKLIEAKLLQPADKNQYLAKIADGTITQQDWRLAIELAHGKEEQ